jgi:hypothetical protein
MNARAFTTMSQSPTHATWNDFQNGFSSDTHYGWEEAEEETDPVLKMYREENQKLLEENGLLKKRLAALERQHEHVSNQLQQMMSDVSNYNAQQPKRPTTPVTPKEGLSAMESEKVYWQRKIGRSPPKTANFSRFIPPRFQNLTAPTGGGAAAVSRTSPRPKTPEITNVQNDSDDELFRTLRSAYERGCDEAGFPTY